MFDRHRVTCTEASFSQRGEEDENGGAPLDTIIKKVSATCRQFEKETCAYKKKHTRKEYPANIWGINKDKTLDNKGRLILYTLCEFEEAPVFNDDNLINDGIYEVKDTVKEHDKLNSDINFYMSEYCRSLSLEKFLGVAQAHVFATNSFELRAANLLSQNKGKINANWVLLDSQSTMDLLFNASLLRNIRTVGESLNIYCNAGVTTTNMVGDLDIYGTVWYHHQGIANILSLYRVTDIFHVEFDSRVNNNFIVWRSNGLSRHFTPGPRRLYYCDMTKINGIVLTITSTIYDVRLGSDPVHIDTIKKNLKGFTQQQIRDATTSRKFQNNAGPTTTGMISVVDRKILNNSPITRVSIKHVLSIWGSNVPTLDGKTIRRK